MKNLAVSVNPSVKCLRGAFDLLITTSTALLLCVPMFAQGNAGRILGSVSDQAGGVLTGASVVVTDVQRGITRTLTTDEAGQYLASNLLPGEYSVRAESKGFKKVERPNIGLEVGKDVRVDFVLPTGDVTQEIPTCSTHSARYPPVASSPPIAADYANSRHQGQRLEAGRRGTRTLRRERRV